tara:strand:+ start:147 stop:713 length:567 start_codon:yes stop_codon:yes gene_type:complete
VVAVTSQDLWVGVDPGKTGGIAILDSSGGYVAHSPIPLVGVGTKRARVDCRAIKEWWLEVTLKNRWHVRPSRITWAIERVSSAPTDGVVGAFSFGKATGAIFAFAETMGFAITEISPKDWQKVWLAGQRKNTRKDIKASAALVAADRWPELSSDLRLKKNWGLADAALIAATARVVEMAGADAVGGVA